MGEAHVLLLLVHPHPNSQIIIFPVLLVFLVLLELLPNKH